MVGTNNQHADALSWQPVLPAPTDAEVDSEVQVAQVAGNTDPYPNTIVLPLKDNLISFTLVN